MGFLTRAVVTGSGSMRARSLCFFALACTGPFAAWLGQAAGVGCPMTFLLGPPQALVSAVLDVVRRGDELRDIGIEAVQLAIGTGPRRAAQRGVTAAVALASTAQALVNARRSGQELRPEASDDMPTLQHTRGSPAFLQRRAQGSLNAGRLARAF